MTINLLPLPSFLDRVHPDCVATARRPRDQGLVLRAKKPAKRWKSHWPVTMAKLRTLGWSLAAIRKLSAARAEKLAHNRIRPGEERLLDGDRI